MTILVSVIVMDAASLKREKERLKKRKQRERLKAENKVTILLTHDHATWPIYQRGD